MLSNFDEFKTEKFFLSLIGLVSILGVIMVYSSSYIFAKETYGSSSFYLIRQVSYMAIGALMAFAVSKTKYTFWIKYSFYFSLFVSSLLICTFIPSLSSEVNGASRWLSIGGFTFQPGEIAKFSVLLSSVFFFERFHLLNTNEKVKYGLTLLLPVILVLLQPDFGTFSICFIIISFVCFLSRFPRKYFYSGLGGGILLAIPILISQPYRVQRLFAFLDPWKNAKTSGFQIIQSYLALANGSIIGQGLGNSNEKLFYLPEAHNDFIFSVIGEELGLLGVVSVALLFLFLVALGLRLASFCNRRDAAILVSAITFTIGLQACLNMGVVLGLLPTKGLNLPFISYGGSSLMANFFAVGLIISVMRTKQRDHAFRAPDPSSYRTGDLFENQQFPEV